MKFVHEVNNEKYKKRAKKQKITSKKQKSATSN